MRVVVVADVLVRAEAYAAALAQHGYRAASAVPGTAESALVATHPHVVVVDVPPPAGLRFVRRLTTRRPAQPVVVVALGKEDEDVVLAWAEAGAAGYVTAADALDRLLDTLEQVVAGEAQVSPRVVAALMRRVAVLSAAVAAEPLVGLTDREEEVALLLQAGLSNKEIAQRLSIEVATVKNHVHSILGKLNVRRRGEAVAVMHGRGAMPVLGDLDRRI